MDLIYEAAKYLATLYHLLVILSAVQKLFGVKDSQIYFFFKSHCLSQTSGLQDECTNMSVWVRNHVSGGGCVSKAVGKQK